MNDELGNRMKMYEGMYSDKYIPLLPVCVRLDGKNFSKWTKDLDRPYDVEMSELMIKTTQFLVQETQAVIGYTQSDEISLIYYTDNIGSQLFFDGKVQKMCSVIASMTTAKFNGIKDTKTKFNSKPYGLFDCRIWQVPTLQEAVNVLIWRELDATKNSITMAASSIYSHKQLHKKNGKEKMEMLMEKGINWNDYPNFFKRGTYIKKVKKEIPIPEEQRKIHNIKNKNYFLVEGTKVIRSVVEVLSDFPKLTSIANPVDVIFNNSDIIYK